MAVQNNPPDDRFALVVEVYLHTKALILDAEEFDVGFRSFLQPKLELVNALEHIMRIEARKLRILESGRKDEPPADGVSGYTQGNVDKALGHVYRAFFDTADWFAIRIREKIQQGMSGYSHVCISTVAPEYYRVIRPKLEQAAKDIAAIRKNKDVSGDDILEEVERYTEVLRELREYSDGIDRMIPSLQEYQEKEAGAEKKEWQEKVYFVLVGAGLATLGALLLKLL